VVILIGMGYRNVFILIGMGYRNVVILTGIGYSLIGPHERLKCQISPLVKYRQNKKQ